MREKAVLGYLRDNPAFLRRNQAELKRMLRLAERDIIDLAGQQLATMRDTNEMLLKQLGEWYGNASENERTLEFLHRLTTSLLAAKGSRGETMKILKKEVKGSLGVRHCRVVDLADGKAKLEREDRKRLEDDIGAVRTDKPLKSVAKHYRGDRWRAFLNVPVFSGKKVRALIVFATDRPADFPRNAQDDYARRLSEVVSASLAREK